MLSVSFFQQEEKGKKNNRTCSIPSFVLKTPIVVTTFLAFVNQSITMAHNPPPLAPANARANGNRYRDVHMDQRVAYRVHTPRATHMPEWNEQYVCPVCLKQNIIDYHSHVMKYCEDQNAWNKINSGYCRAYVTQPGMTAPPILSGDVYRYIRDALEISPMLIMQQRGPGGNWSPFDQITDPQTGQVMFFGNTYHVIRQMIEGQLPATFGVPPRETPQKRALFTLLAQPTTRSYWHQTHIEEERDDMVAVSNFFDAHPQCITAFQNHGPYNCPNWQDSNVHRAKHGTPPAVGVFGPNPTVTLDLAPNQQGICGSGSGGIEGRVMYHFNTSQPMTFGRRIYGEGPPVNQYAAAVNASQSGVFPNLPKK